VVLINIKRIDIKEFREMGFLAEVNRTFFHPLGLALEVYINEDGVEQLGGIWDYRNDPEGILYGKFPAEKIKKAHEFIKTKHEQRNKTLGFVYQAG